MIALALLGLAGPRPVDGPALSIPFLSKPAYTTVERNWSRGLYDVRFDYKIPKSVSELAAICKRLPGIDNSPYNIAAPSADNFAIKRWANGTKQIISVSRVTLGFIYVEGRRVDVGKRGKSVTVVTVQETPDPSRLPNNWYKGAISPKPPAPLLEVPFMPGVKFPSVSLVSLEHLMSSKGGMDTGGTDCAVYTIALPGPGSAIAAKLDAWANANGYRKTPVGTYFKPGVKIFEISGSGTPKQARVTMWTTDQYVGHPIVWDHA